MVAGIKPGAKERQNGGEVKKPDFEGALRVLRADVNPATEGGAKLRGDLSAAWKSIENDHHCNKKGAKFVHGLMRMDVQVRDDVLRTVYGLMRAAGIGISEDLVSLMNDDEDSEMPRVPVVSDALDKAKKHFGADDTNPALN